MAEEMSPTEKRFRLLEIRLQKSFQKIKADMDALRQSSSHVVPVDYKSKKNIDAFKNATHAAIADLRKQIQSQQGQEMMTMFNEVRTEAVTKSEIARLEKEIHDKIDSIRVAEFSAKDVADIRKDISALSEAISKRQDKLLNQTKEAHIELEKELRRVENELTKREEVIDSLQRQVTYLKTKIESDSKETEEKARTPKVKKR